MSRVVDISIAKANCLSCRQAQTCLPQGLSSQEIRKFSAAVKRNRVFQRGDALFRQGDKLDSLYLIRSGTVKIYSLNDDGDEQVLGFYLAGDVVGLDALDEGIHDCTAVVLETSGICELSFNKLEDLALTLSGLQRRLHRLYGREIARDHALLRLLGHKSAEQRLAGFLWHLIERINRQGYSTEELNLSMSRHDIANYLGLAVETVSRLFRRLQEQGILEVDRRHIKLCDQAQLQHLAGCVAAVQAAQA